MFQVNSSHKSSSRPAQTAVAAALFLTALGLCWYYLRGAPPVLPLDDAYIHFVYAENLADGNGLCFNAGRTSFGSSSPLWVALLALCARAGLPLYP